MTAALAALMAGGGALLPSAGATAADAIGSTPLPPPGAKSTSFGYTGGVQSWTVPAGIGWVQVKVIGGAGGMNSSFDGGSDGAEVTGTIKVSANDTLLLSVAGAGGQSNGSWTNAGPGGWGGLGAVGGEGNSASDDLRNGGAGGGASTVEVVSASSGEAAPMVIAGGGGGMGGASGDPDHAGDGGSGGDGGWTGGGGHHGTEGPLGGSGGAAGSGPTTTGERGHGGSGAGGNGGSGGGGQRGGGAGGGADGASAGGGGGAGSSWVDPSVLSPTVQPSGVHWDNPVVNPFQSVPNGSIVVTEIPLLSTSVLLAVENPEVQVGVNAGPLTAVIATVDGYVPSGTVDFFDVTAGSGPDAVSLGTSDVSEGVGAIATATFSDPGTRRLQAVWSGDDDYAPQSSPIFEVTVTADGGFGDVPTPGSDETAPAPDRTTDEPATTSNRSTALAATGPAGAAPGGLAAAALAALGLVALLAARVSKRRRTS